MVEREEMAETLSSENLGYVDWMECRMIGNDETRSAGGMVIVNNEQAY